VRKDGEFSVFDVIGSGIEVIVPQESVDESFALSIVEVEVDRELVLCFLKDAKSKALEFL
jgi:hypothetical protein